MKTAGSAHWHAHQPTITDRDLTFAWIAVALIPVIAFAGFAAGEGTASLLGHPAGGDMPMWVSLIVDVVATVICLVPCAAAIFFSRRAIAAGERRGMVPLVIAAIVGVAFIAMTVVTEIGNAT